MRITPICAVLAGLAAVPAGAVTALAMPSQPSSPLLSRYEHQRLDWGACSAEQKELNEAGAQCAKVTVPLDYSAPGGRTIQIEISRIKAKDEAGRRGVLLSNPGGPGGPGLANTLALRPALRRRHRHQLSAERRPARPRHHLPGAGRQRWGYSNWAHGMTG